MYKSHFSRRNIKNPPALSQRWCQGILVFMSGFLLLFDTLPLLAVAANKKVPYSDIYYVCFFMYYDPVTDESHLALGEDSWNKISVQVNRNGIVCRYVTYSAFDENSVAALYSKDGIQLEPQRKIMENILASMKKMGLTPEKFFADEPEWIIKK